MASNFIKIGNGIQLTAIATVDAPASPVNGMFYYDTTLGQFQYRTGGAWVSSPGTVTLPGGVTGVLAVANGGTNSSTALNNNRVIQSSGGAIIESAAITASRALASDVNGIPVASATTAAELAFVNGVTSAIQTQINTKISDVVQDTTPQLGGALDVNGNSIVSAANGNIQIAPNGTGHIQIAKQGAATRFFDMGYIDAITLTASTTAVAAALTFDSTLFKGQFVDYVIIEATTLARRIGRLMVVGDDITAVASSNVGIVDQSTETADIGVTWTAAVNGNNIELSYTTTANAKTMQVEVKRFLA